jgi:hypothetical protein
MPKGMTSHHYDLIFAKDSEYFAIIRTQGGRLNFSFRRKIFLVLIAISLGCTSQVSPPGIYTPNREGMNFEVCRNTKVSLKNLNAVELKSLVSCLNANGQLQPIKDFVYSIEDKELDSVIGVFDRHFAKPDKRLDRMLDLATRARDKGLFDGLYKGLDTTSRTHSVQDLLVFLGKLVTYLKKDPNYDNKASLLKKFGLDLIDSRASDQVFVASGKMLNGIKGKSLAFMLSRTSEQFPLNSDQIVDEMAKLSKLMMTSKDLKALQILSTDSVVHQVVSSTTGREIIEIEKLLTEVNKNASRGELNRLLGLQRLITKTDRTMICFDNGTNARSFHNLIDAVAEEEGRRRHDTERLNRFWLVEMPVMIGASISKCDLDPSVVNDLNITSDLAKMGLVPGLAAAKIPFYDKGRGQYFKRILKSNNFVASAPLIENLAVRQGFTYFHEMVSRTLTPKDFQALSQVATGLAIDDRSGASLEQWITAKFRNPTAATLQSILDSLPIEQRRLSKLLVNLDQTGKVDLATEVRMSLAEETATAPIESAYYTLIDAAFSSELRPELKKVAKSLVASWGELGGGWGGLFDMIAANVALAQERPFQDGLASVLKNEADFEVLVDFVVKHSDSDLLHKAIDHAGGMAGDGNLDRLVGFLLDFFKASGTPGLETPPESTGYAGSEGEPDYTVLAGRKPEAPVPAHGDFTSCDKIRGDIFEASGETFYNALKCFDYNKGGAGLAKLADILKSGGLLKDVTKLISEKVMSSDHIHAVLDDLQSLVSSGHFKRLFSLIQMSVEEPYYLHQLADPMLSGLLTSSRVNPALDGVGQVLKSSHFQNAGPGLIDAISGDLKEPVLRSVNSYIVPIAAEVRNQAFAKVPGLTEADFQRAKQEFHTRSDDYFYRQGVYKNFTDAELRDELVNFFRKLVQPNTESGYGAAEAQIDAMSSLAVEQAQGKINFAEFLRWGVSTQRAIPYWVGENSNPEVRIVAPFDQLDLLVINSNIGVASFTAGLGIGTAHLGTLFQTEIAKAPAFNYRPTLDDLKSKLDIGLSLTCINPFKKKECNHLKNNRENFQILYDMADAGHMRIQQRLYQTFRNATPSAYYDKEDPINNLIGMTHKHVEWGMFARMVAPIHYVASTGQLAQLGKGLIEAGPLFKMEDVPKLRSALAKMLVNRPDRVSDVGYFIENLFKLIDGDPQNFIKFKTMMFHYILNWSRFTDRTVGVVELFELVAKDQKIVTNIIDWMFEDIRKEEKNSQLYKMMVNLTHVQPSRMSSIKALGTLLLKTNNPLNESYSLALGDMFVSLYKKDQYTFDQLFDRMKVFSNDPRVESLNPIDLVKSMIQNYTGTRLIVGEVLTDVEDRKLVERLLQDMSREKISGELLKTLAGLYQTGDLESLILFLNRNAIKIGAQ